MPSSRRRSKGMAHPARPLLGVLISELIAKPLCGRARAPIALPKLLIFQRRTVRRTVPTRVLQLALVIAFLGWADIAPWYCPKPLAEKVLDCPDQLFQVEGLIEGLVCTQFFGHFQIDGGSGFPAPGNGNDLDSRVGRF